MLVEQYDELHSCRVVDSEQIVNIRQQFAIARTIPCKQHVECNSAFQLQHQSISDAGPTTRGHVSHEFKRGTLTTNLNCIFIVNCALFVN